MPRVADFVPPAEIGKGRRPDPKWDEFMDGKLWVFTQGTDFTSITPTFVQRVKSEAKKRHISVRCNCRRTEVYVQAILNGESA